MRGLAISSERATIMAPHANDNNGITRNRQACTKQAGPATMREELPNIILN